MNYIQGQKTFFIEGGDNVGRQPLSKKSIEFYRQINLLKKLLLQHIEIWNSINTHHQKWQNLWMLIWSY